MERSADVVRAVARDCPRVSLAANGTNRFYAKAANQAASLAQGEAFLFLNPDARLYPGWRERFERLVLDPPTRRPVGAGLGVRAYSASETRSMHRFLTAARCASSRSGSARSADGTRWVSMPRPAR